MKKSSTRPKEEWRAQILKSVGRLFEDRKDSALYGPRHALAVEDCAVSIGNASDCELTSETDKALLRTAALLHDVGFARRAEHWSPDHFEHLQAGQELAIQILGQNPLFRKHPERINRVLSLIKHHDDTKYSFPSATSCGRPRVHDVKSGSDRHDGLLTILQEADSRVHARRESVVLASQEWQDQLLPLFGLGPAPLATWQCMDSIIGNIRIVAKCAVIDAQTRDGQQAALDTYQRLEDHVRVQCAVAGIAYEAEACPPSMREASIKRFADKPFNLQIVTFHPWSQLECGLRAIPLLHDRTIHPYVRAKIQMQVIDLETVTPMALYVLESRLDEVLELHDALMVAYCFGIWDLPGLLEFQYDSEEVQRLAPPIIEDYVETASSHSRRVLGLVDGLHRCKAARDEGLSKIRAVLAEDVPYPLVPLPTDWRLVQVYEDHNPPPDEHKRDYRYTTLDEFPFDLCQTSIPVTEQNFQYFFYRDLGALGSRGKRDFREFESNRAD